VFLASSFLWFVGRAANGRWLVAAGSAAACAPLGFLVLVFALLLHISPHRHRGWIFYALRHRAAPPRHHFPALTYHGIVLFSPFAPLTSPAPSSSLPSLPRGSLWFSLLTLQLLLLSSRCCLPILVALTPYRSFGLSTRLRFAIIFIRGQQDVAASCGGMAAACNRFLYSVGSIVLRVVSIAQPAASLPVASLPRWFLLPPFSCAGSLSFLLHGSCLLPLPRFPHSARGRFRSYFSPLRSRLRTSRDLSAHGSCCLFLPRVMVNMGFVSLRVCVSLRTSLTPSAVRCVPAGLPRSLALPLRTLSLFFPLRLCLLYPPAPLPRCSHHCTIWVLLGAA